MTVGNMEDMIQETYYSYRRMINKIIIFVYINFIFNEIQFEFLTTICDCNSLTP